MSEVVTIQVVPEQARIVIDEGADTLTVVPGPDVVRVVSTAAIGPVGPQGPPGVSGASYVHDQATPSSLWTITHNLGRFPSVTVVDSASNVVLGDVKYISNNEVTVTFASAFGGRAFVN